MIGSWGDRFPKRLNQKSSPAVTAQRCRSECGTLGSALRLRERFISSGSRPRQSDLKGSPPSPGDGKENLRVSLQMSVQDGASRGEESTSPVLSTPSDKDTGESDGFEPTSLSETLWSFALPMYVVG